MQLISPQLQQLVGVDYGSFTHSEVSEICVDQIVQAIGRGTRFNVESIRENVPDITGLRLVDKMECDLGDDSQVNLRVCITFDWPKQRMSIAAGEDKVTLELVPGTMTFPALKRQADALEVLLRGIDILRPFERMTWCYSFDADAVERRGSDWIAKKLGTQEMSEEISSRYNKFEPGRHISHGLSLAPHQRLCVTLARGL